MSPIHLQRALLVVVGTALMWACTGSSGERPMATNREAASPPPVENVQTPEERGAAIAKARADEGERFKRLAAAVQAEARNEAWASQKERELEKSYAARADRPGVLKSIVCRSTNCELQFELATPEERDATGGQFAAINEWIAASQPCGYTIMAGDTPVKGPATIRIFLDCGQQVP